MNLKPTKDRIVIRLTEAQTKSQGGIIIPDAATEKPQTGEVIAVGSGIVEVAVGNKVLISANAGQPVKVSDEEFQVLKEEDIIAIIE